MSHQLKVTGGPGKGKSINVTPGQVFVIGRGADVHLSIPEDQTLSRAHAEVAHEGGQWILRNKSQHGTLMGGQVFQDQRPLAEGATFTVGGSEVTFMGGAADASGGGKAAMAGAGAALGGAASALGGLSGGSTSVDLPAELSSHQGPGFPLGAIVKGSFAVVKANLVPSILFVLLCMIPLLNFVMMIIGPYNYMNAVKEFLHNGKPMAVGDFFKFDDFVPRLLLLIMLGIINMIGAFCFGIPGLFMFFAVPLLVDKPGTSFMSCIKASAFWTLSNPVPNLLGVFLLGLLYGVLYIVGMIPCGLGLFIVMPMFLTGVWLAYDLKKGEIEAAAAEKGVSLA